MGQSGAVQGGSEKLEQEERGPLSVGVDDGEGGLCWGSKGSWSLFRGAGRERVDSEDAEREGGDLANGGCEGAHDETGCCISRFAFFAACLGDCAGSGVLALTGAGGVFREYLAGGGDVDGVLLLLLRLPDARRDGEGEGGYWIGFGLVELDSGSTSGVFDRLRFRSLRSSASGSRSLMFFGRGCSDA